MWAEFDAYGGQGPNDPPNNVTATFSLNGDKTTDSNGQVTYAKAFLSGNRTEDTVVEAVLPNGSGPTATFNQVWDECQDGTDWPESLNDPYFVYDTPCKVTFAPQFGNPPIAITKHQLSFIIQTASVTTYYEDGTTDSTVYSGSDAAAWASFDSPTAHEDSPGFYTSGLVVPDPDGGTFDPTQFSDVTEVTFNVNDQDAYYAE